MSAIARTSAPKVASVWRTFKFGDIQRALAGKGFKAFLYGANVIAIKQLNINQYTNLLKLLTAVKTHILDKGYVIDGLLPLNLPSGSELKIINFDKLLGSPKAMAEVMSRGVMPGGRAEVDLKKLLWIYEQYVSDKA